LSVEASTIVGSVLSTLVVVAVALGIALARTREALARLTAKVEALEEQMRGQ